MAGLFISLICLNWKRSNPTLLLLRISVAYARSARQIWQKRSVSWSSHPQVISLAPHTIEQVFQDVETVGKVIGRDSEARILVNELRDRVKKVESAVEFDRPPRVLCLEWLTPLFQGGHWIPEMVAIAGGDAVLATPGEQSICISWNKYRKPIPKSLLSCRAVSTWKRRSHSMRMSIFPKTGCEYLPSAMDRSTQWTVRLIFASGTEACHWHRDLQAILKGHCFDELPLGSVAKL
jgi:hypothetical protein